VTSQKRWILAAVILGSSIVFLDSTVVNVALPKIGQEFPNPQFVGRLEGQSYVYNGYLLALSALLILAGALSDFYGRKRMYVLGLAGFGITSVLCGLAPSMELLILFRILQGAAGALLVPGSLAILTQTFSGEERGRVFGIWAGASAATTLFGPFLGGLLVDFVSWRLAFLINVPLVIFAIYATVRELPEHRASDSGHFDWLGAFVIAVAVGGLSFGAIRGQERNWTEPLAFVALGIGAVATVAFPILMARSAHPLVPLHLFRSRNFSVTNLSTLVIYGALYVFSYFNSLFLQGTIGYTASASGISGVPSSLFLVFLSARFGTLAGRFGPRWFMALGPAIMGLGVLWLARFPSTSAPWLLNPSKPETILPSAGYLFDLLPSYLLFGIGLTIMVAPLTTALMSSVPAANSGIASAINNAISRVGPQLAGAVIFIALTAAFYTSLGDRVPGLDTSSPELRQQVSPLNPPEASVPPDVVAAAHDASTDAYHLAMLVAAGLLLAGAAVNAVGIRNESTAAAVLDAQARPAEG